MFRDGAGQFPHFSFSKYYWAGEGQRGWIASKIEKKLNPGSGLDGEPSDLEAAKWEMLVPAFAPGCGPAAIMARAASFLLG